MDDQDWTVVTLHRRRTKKEAIVKGNAVIQPRDVGHNERIRMAKLDNSDTPAPKKHVDPNSLQSLIRKRIEMKLTQERADNLCAFPRNSFKDIESNRYLPSEEQKRRIHHNLGIQLKYI